ARVDMEHSSPSIETVADMSVLSRALDFPLVVRPPEGNREWITRLLDVGVWGLHIPQVDTPEIAYQVAQAARYAPVGARGHAGVQLIAYSSDVAVLRSGYATAVGQLHEPNSVTSHPAG